MSPIVRIGLHGPDPANELWRALEQAFPVRFVDGAAGSGDDPPAARITDTASDVTPVFAEPTLRLAPDGNIVPGTVRPIRFADHDALDARLRNRTVQEGASAPPLDTEAGDEILASDAKGPVWTLRRGSNGVTARSAFSAPALRDGTLRENLTDGNCLPLLPIVEFLRSVTGYRDWSRPPLQASFLFDDPNLHWPVYGHVDYRKMLRDSEEHCYHVGMAMIPLDTWFTHGEAARLFREHPKRLSLVIHGNDHRKRELHPPSADADLVPMLGQALRRIARFEDRMRIPVGRIMVPPHSACSEAAARSMLQLGFEACCTGLPIPWLERYPRQLPLAGWNPAEFVAGGMPVSQRLPFNTTSGDLLLMAYLDQPIVLYGHHEDIAGGLEPLRDAAERVRQIGDVEWMSLQQIVGSQVWSRTIGDELRIRMWSRSSRIRIPPGIARIVVESRAALDGLVAVRVGEAKATLQSADGAVAATESIAATPGTLEVRLETPRARAAREIPPPPRSLWPGVRRLLTEGRDRLRPLVRRT